jgi:hypothetical protein
MLERYLADDWNYGADARDRTADVSEFLGPQAAWVERLTTWAQNDESLVAAHAQSYLAWHCQGGIVLKIARTRQGLSVSGGIQYSDRSRLPERIDLAEPLTSAEAHRLIGQAALAAARLLDGDDGGRREHRLQEALARMRPLPLGLTDALRREYPSWRPYLKPRGRSFIDFLGCDAGPRLRVIETKIGSDPMLVLQGLDYWIWVMANRAELARRFGLPTDEPQVAVDFVVSRTGHGKPAMGPYTASQSAALAGDVTHRFWEISGWEAGNPVVESVLLDGA